MSSKIIQPVHQSFASICEVEDTGDPPRKSETIEGGPGSLWPAGIDLSNAVGTLDGRKEGTNEGNVEGTRDGTCDGTADGKREGPCEGINDGESEGI